jgi:hypothetical protein
LDPQQTSLAGDPPAPLPCSDPPGEPLAPPSPPREDDAHSQCLTIDAGPPPFRRRYIGPIPPGPLEVDRGL